MARKNITDNIGLFWPTNKTDVFDNIGVYDKIVVLDGVRIIHICVLI